MREEKDMSVREQADAHRAARGLTPEERHIVALTYFQWWTVGGPHRQTVASRYGGEALCRMGDRINEAAKDHPELVRKAVEEVRAHIERFKARRQTPRLILTPHGAKFAVRQYDYWGQFAEERTTWGSEDVRPFSHGSSPDWIEYLTRRTQWDAHNARLAADVASGKLRVNRPVPDWFREAVRDWYRINKRSTLIPTPAERQRYRKAAGLVKSRKKATA